MSVRRTGAGALVLAAALLHPAIARAATPETRALDGYLGALAHGRYADAFARLTPSERRYFGSAEHYASVFATQRLQIDSFAISATRRTARGIIALVTERIRIVDRARDAMVHATARVAYGVVGDRRNGYAITDSYHPWRTLAPAAIAADVRGVRVTLRTASFYAGRVELVVSFADTGRRSATILAYGRSTLRDENGRPYAPIASRVAGLTDRVLFEGLRLSADAEYTGSMSFLTPTRFVPRSLALTIAPAIEDGDDAPFAIALPAFGVAP